MARSKHRSKLVFSFHSREEGSSLGGGIGLPPKGPKRRPSSHGREASPLKTPEEKSPNEWFGPQVAGKRKIARPFIAGASMEALFLSEKAQGKWALNLPQNEKKIRAVLSEESRRSQVHVKRVKIEAGALRLELQAPRRTALSLFLRSVAGKVPRGIAQAEKGRPLSSGRVVKAQTRSRQFWDGLVATRILREQSAS